MVRRTTVTMAGAAIVTLLAFTGCAAAPAPADTSLPGADATPSAGPTVATSPEPPTVTVNEVQGEACAGLRSISNSAPADGVERILGEGLPGDAVYVSGYALPELRDTGATEYAAGDALVNEDGTPASYVVASGDTLYGISERFCVQFPMYLEWINSVRRNGAWDWTTGEDGPFEIFPGDTLNLDAHTITSVGDERGVVYSHQSNFYIPPQR
jgi:hypothetical protein